MRKKREEGPGGLPLRAVVAEKGNGVYLGPRGDDENVVGLREWSREGVLEMLLREGYVDEADLGEPGPDGETPCGGTLEFAYSAATMFVNGDGETVVVVLIPPSGPGSEPVPPGERARRDAWLAAEAADRRRRRR